jgi:hypothetical protein
MQNILHNKAVLYGGGALVAIVAGLYIFNSVGSTSAAAAPAVNTFGSTLTPVTYSSGTGTVPIDSAGGDTGGSSTINALMATLTGLATASNQSTADYQNKSLDLSYALGVKNIDANSAMNSQNATYGLAAALGSIGAQLAQSVVSAKATSAVSGTLNGAGQNFNFTVEQVTGNSAWNKPLVNVSGGGITLADGRLVKG